MAKAWRFLLRVLPRDRLSPSVNGALRDFLIVAVTVSWTFALAAIFGLFELIVTWDRAHRTWHIGEVTVVAAVSAFVLGGLLVYRGLHLYREMRQRQRADAALREANARLTAWVGELEQRDHNNAILNETGDLLQACLTAEELAAVTSRSGRHLFPGLSGGLYALRPSRDVLEPIAHWGEYPPSGDPFSPAECWAFRRGKPHLGGDSAGGPQCKHVGQVAPAGYLCVPLVAQGDLVGVLHLSAGPEQLAGQAAAFPEARRHLAQLVGERIALQLANLRLRQSLRDQAIRDPLTGLYNRRYLEETIERELHRCERAGRPVAAMMFDVDHFKRFNDLHGHAVGDAVLMAIGTYLMTHIRREDIACRLGGDEFALIIPDIDLETAAARAEELRQGLRDTSVQHLDRPLGPVTASIGVATFPGHGDTAERLLRAADLALYQAKAAGRNRVAMAATQGDRPSTSTAEGADESQPAIVAISSQRHFKTSPRTASPSRR